jgi:rhomboid protease GluP
MRDESEPIHPLERRRREVADAPPPELPPPPPPVSWEEWLSEIRRIWGVWVLIVVNVAIFVLGGLDDQNIGLRAAEGGLNAFLVLERGEYSRLVTAMFLHGSLIHLGFNMLALYNIGSWVEVMFGHRRFWTIYLLSGLSGTVMGTLLSASQVFSVGASGAIFGIIGALILFFYRHNTMLNEGLREVRRSLVFSAVATLAIGFVPGSIIDNWGHLGGFLMGAALGYGILPHYQRVTAPHPETGEPVIGVRDIQTRGQQNTFAIQAGLVLIAVLLFAGLIRQF